MPVMNNTDYMKMALREAGAIDLANSVEANGIGDPMIGLLALEFPDQIDTIAKASHLTHTRFPHPPDVGEWDFESWEDLAIVMSDQVRSMGIVFSEPPDQQETRFPSW